MIYLPGNNSAIWRLHREGFPVGMMFSPEGVRRPFRDDVRLDYAIDNGLYHPFGEAPKPECERGRFYGMCAKVCREKWHAPMFGVVPDRPYDAEGTYRELVSHAPILRRLFPQIPLALAVQDGMRPNVAAYLAREQQCAWLFVAGSDEWKDRTVWEWVEQGSRRGLKVHLARANETKRIELARRAGCDSADGTGIFRGDKKQKARVLRALIQELMFVTDNPYEKIVA